MGEFSADWLTVREGPDGRSRNQAAVMRLADHVSTRRFVAGERIGLLDLGTGTGSNMRCLAPQLPMPQLWRLVDRDTDLLRQLPKRTASWALDRGAIVTGNPGAFAVRGPELDCRCETRAIDLARLIDHAFATELFAAGTIVTASALLDLVSRRWLEALVARCRAAATPILFVLTYDGRLSCTPADEDDEWIRELVNRHQRSVKGFGRALGPDATAVAAGLFRDAGYDVWSGPSDWRLTPGDRVMQQMLIDGWAAAAAEVAPNQTARCETWRQRRQSFVEAGLSFLLVGHQDLAGWPPA